MSYRSQYLYPSPLAGFENAEPLSEEKDEDGKSLVNPPREGLSEAYEAFVDPLDKSRRGGLCVRPVIVIDTNGDETS